MIRRLCFFWAHALICICSLAQPLSADTNKIDPMSDPCSWYAVYVLDKDTPYKDIDTLRAACSNIPEPDTCPITNRLIKLHDPSFKEMECGPANALRAQKEKAEADAEKARLAPYEMTEKEVLEVQTALIECRDANIGLPDGKMGKKTKASISSFTSGGPFNKEAFDRLLAGCADDANVYAAASIASDAAYGVAYGHSSGVEALQAAITECRRKSTLPDSCISMLATTQTKNFHPWLDLGDKNPKPGIAVGECVSGNRRQTLLMRGPFKETAKAYFNDNVKAQGFRRSNCKIFTVVDAFGTYD